MRSFETKLSKFWLLLFSAALSFWTQPSRAALNITVDAAAAACPTCPVNHPISPYIYGWNNISDTLNSNQRAALQALKLGAVRWGGGNNGTRFNWKVKGSTHPDWYFNNYPQDHDAGIATIKSLKGPVAVFPMPSMKLPSQDAIMVAADATTANGGPGCACNNTGPYWTTNFTSSDEQNWLTYMNITNAATKYVKIWQMDNEAMIWGATHKDVHNSAHGYPNTTTYDEYWEDFSFLAPKLKQVDPSIMVTGDVACNYWFYFHDGASAIEHSTDWETWFLQQAKNYETTNGQRILDVLDLHFYPSVNGSGVTEAQRLAEIRNWWDPSYSTSLSCSYNCPPQILPRFQNLIATYYPGTKLAFSEYNWADDSGYAGALALGAALGWFGKYNVYFSTYWSDNTTLVDNNGNPLPLYEIMKMYTNYFGSTACKADSSDATQVCSFGALDGSGNLTLMLVNTSGSSQPLNFSLANFNPSASINPSVTTWVSTAMTSLSSSSLAPVGSSFSYTVPAYSQVLIVVPKEIGSPTPTPTFCSACTATPSSTPSPTAGVTPPALIFNTCDTMTYNGTWSGANAVRSIATGGPFVSQGSGALYCNITVSAAWQDNFASLSGFAPGSLAGYVGLSMDVYVDPAATPFGSWAQLELYADSAASGKWYQPIAGSLNLSKGMNHLVFAFNFGAGTILNTDTLSRLFFILNSGGGTGNIYFDNMVLLTSLPTPTPSSTNTATRSFTATASITPTFSASPSASFTPSATPSNTPPPGSSATFTPSFSATLTPSPSPLLSVTATYTLTQALTASATPASAGQSGPPNVRQAMPVPNPLLGNAKAGFAYYLEAPASAIQIKIYSRAMVLITQFSDGAKNAGWQSSSVDPSSLSSGQYYYLVVAQSGSSQGTAARGEWVIQR